jgi:hypothetical protein
VKNDKNKRQTKGLTGADAIKGYLSNIIFVWSIIIYLFFTMFKKFLDQKNIVSIPRFMILMMVALVDANVF